MLNLRTSFALVTVVAGVLALSACSPATPRLSAEPPATTAVPATPRQGAMTASPRATPLPPTDNTLLTDCESGVAYVRGSAAHVDITQDCERLEVDGQDLDITFGDISVDHLIVRGDRNTFHDVSLVSAEISGQSNLLAGSGIGSLVIRGDRNATSLEGTLGSASVDGNDNDLLAGTLGEIQDLGDRNASRTN